MIPMSELVKDPSYKRFLQTKPTLPPIARDPKMVESPPWVVYVQKEMNGPWGKREFWKYKDAFKFFAKALKRGVHDAALNCKRVGFDPPMKLVKIKGKYVVGSDGVKRQATKYIPWRPKLLPEDPDHHWCKYCRRPTVFKYYSTHKRLRACGSGVPRCCICGASARIALPESDKFYRVH